MKIGKLLMPGQQCQCGVTENGVAQQYDRENAVRKTAEPRA